jgi:lipopolysaccharide heptosyltransferase II
MTHPVQGKRYEKHQHETRYVLDLARVAGACVEPGDERPWLAVLPAACDTIDAHLEAARETLGRHGPVIAIHPGAKNGRAKRWPIQHYSRLSDRLSRELNALIVLTGSPNERLLTDALAARMTEPHLDLTGKTSLPELTALMAASAVVVTGDSGPMHIACAVNTPVVAIHGPTDPELSGPSAPDAFILRRDLWCAPCYDASATAECRFGNPVCMKDISPAEVFTATLAQLQVEAPRPANATPARYVAARTR